MKNCIRLLLVDDHPIILTAYKKTLEQLEAEHEDLNFEITLAHNIPEALAALSRFNTIKPLDWLFIDLNLPAYPERNLYSGEDLALKIRENFSQLKIIVCTTYNSNYRIHSLFNTLNPNAFLVKNDIDVDQIKQAVLDLVTDNLYYSKTVRLALRQNMSTDFLLDKLDRHLLYHLSIGTKLKNLPDVLPLSLGGIQKRKKRLKDIFGIDSNSDAQLIEKAKELGFL